MPRYSVPDDSPPPSTPDRRSRNGPALFHFGDNPSTTPAGPPPSSTATFTPAGAPSASYLGSSIMRGVTSQKPPSVNPINFGSRASAGGSSPNKNLLGRGGRSPLGRSVKSSQGRQPSKLSRQLPVEDSEVDADGDDDVLEQPPPRSFGLEYSDSEDGEGDEDDEGDDEENVPSRHTGGRRLAVEEDEDPMVGSFQANDTRDDTWMQMARNPDLDLPSPGDESDLMMLMTPAINERVRREAEDVFRASTMRNTGRGSRDMNFATVAKSLYEQMGPANIAEPALLILDTDRIVSQLYTEGVGTEDDAEKLDAALARASGELVALWKEAVESLPRRDEEHVAGIGPGPHAAPFENAAYLASLALQVHHTRYTDPEQSQAIPLPEILFQWLGENHNLYPESTREVKNFRPSPACHSLFWQTIFMNLLQGRVADAVAILGTAGFEKVRKGNSLAYTDRALSNVKRAVSQTCEVLEICPGIRNDWDLWNSDWILFRVRARGALEQLRRFAEGKDKAMLSSDLPDSGRGGSGRQSMTGLARRAESQVPWDVYENINIIFDILLGDQDRILQVAQDWCEATVAMFGWWDEGGNVAAAAKNANALRMSQSLSRSHAALMAHTAPRIASPEDYLNRLARSFQVSVSSGLEINSNSALEVGMACVFEDNPHGLVGILRSWSVPVAAAVAEIASLGGWLPPHQPSPSSVLHGFDLDMEDLEVLGLGPQNPDDIAGIKDNTLVIYAQSLVNCEELSRVTWVSGDENGGEGRIVDGWELAIHVLGRMDSPDRSEDAVGEIVKTLLEDVDADAGDMVDKVWKLLNNLGMIEFAEETAEHFGDALARDSHRFGEAMWYYSLSHRPSKVREVMNLLIAYSLLQSTAFPHESDLDDRLRLLLHVRNETLAHFAKQDLEAAELLGRMLSGYATLRRFYAIRDGIDSESSPVVPAHRRRAAAAEALIAVISSSDDNVRGGLYDPTRRAVVSEDFLLALLGEATALVDCDNNNNEHNSSRAPVIRGGDAVATAITLDHVDTLLKATEDLVAIKSTSVYSTCDGFFKLTLASAPGLKGSTPADLMRRSTSALSDGSTGGGGGSAGSSYVLSGSFILASQLQRSISASAGALAPHGGGGGGGKGAVAGAVKRGWDWRLAFTATTTADDVLRRLRLGVARDLARLWVAEADGQA